MSREHRFSIITRPPRSEEIRLTSVECDRISLSPRRKKQFFFFLMFSFYSDEPFIRCLSFLLLFSISLPYIITMRTSGNDFATSRSRAGRFNREKRVVAGSSNFRNPVFSGRSDRIPGCPFRAGLGIRGSPIPALPPREFVAPLIARNPPKSGEEPDPRGFILPNFRASLLLPTSPAAGYKRRSAIPLASRTLFPGFVAEMWS